MSSNLDGTAPPGADEVAAVAADVARRVARLCARRGVPLDGADGEAEDPLAARTRPLDAGASVQSLVATGRRRGNA